MNILFCLDTTFSRKNGGIAAVSLTLKKGFEKEGHKCFFISVRNNQEDSIEEQYYLPIASTDSSIEENRSFFQNIVKEKQIDVIINQNGGTPSSLWALEWSKDLPIKKLTVFHGDFSSQWLCHKDNLMENLFVRTFHLKTLINYVWKRLFRIKYRRSLRKQYSLSNNLVFLSEKYFAGFEWFSGIKKDNHFVNIPNPVEAVFNINIKEIKKENIVLYVGRLSQEKRIDYLLKIWRLVYAENPDWSLRIVGDGPMRKQYEDLVSDFQLKNIHFDGYKSPIEYYKKAKLFCLTSETEGFGLVLLEAMSGGCVPLAFNSYASASDIIDTGRCGFLISPFDVEQYAKQLLSLMRESEKLQSMSLEAKKKSMQFHIEGIVTKWERLFI